jgi:Origin recognition complex subunit 6 (ORC6)
MSTSPTTLTKKSRDASRSKSPGPKKSDKKKEDASTSTTTSTKIRKMKPDTEGISPKDEKPKGSRSKSPPKPKTSATLTNPTTGNEDKKTMMTKRVKRMNNLELQKIVNEFSLCRIAALKLLQNDVYRRYFLGKDLPFPVNPDVFYGTYILGTSARGQAAVKDFHSYCKTQFCDENLELVHLVDMMEALVTIKPEGWKSDLRPLVVKAAMLIGDFNIAAEARKAIECWFADNNPRFADQP